MKISRREFIGLMVAAGAAAVLPPLPFASVFGYYLVTGRRVDR